MDIIKNYIDTMFEHLPMTKSVMKAKNELYAMMEDKYQELIAEGKKENEAIGIVISEFGNLDELAEELGLGNIADEIDINDRRYVSQQEAEDYVYASIFKRLVLSLGIMLCIISPVGPIFFSAFSQVIYSSLVEGVGVGFMFLSAAIGVGLIIFSSYTMNGWKFIKKEQCFLDDATIEYLQREKEDNQTGHGMILAIGIMLCIFSVVPAIVFGPSNNVLLSDGVGPSMLFTFVGVGVFLIVFSGARNSAYKKLLSLNGKVIPNYVKSDDYKPTMTEKPEINVNRNYTSNNDTSIVISKNKEKSVYINSTPNMMFPTYSNENKIKSFIRKMVASYWKSVLCIYFIWSALTFSWGSSWIIFPLAAILRGPIEEYFKKN